MTETNALATREQTFDTGQLAVIKRTLMPDGATDSEFQLAIQVCEQTGLNPFKREIYFLKVKGKFIALTGIDGYRSIAERDPQYAGMEGPYWCGSDGEWTDTWISDDPPVAAMVRIHRKDRPHPFQQVVRYKEFYRKSDRPGNPWDIYPAHMLGIVAERHAHRKAFATKTAGLEMAEDYGSSEVSIAEDVPLTRNRMIRMHILAKELGWSDAEKHEMAGVKSLLDLTEREAQRLEDEWTALVYPVAGDRQRVQGQLAAAELSGRSVVSSGEDRTGRALPSPAESSEGEAVGQIAVSGSARAGVNPSEPPSSEAPLDGVDSSLLGEAVACGRAVPAQPRRDLRCAPVVVQGGPDEVEPTTLHRTYESPAGPSGSAGLSASVTSP